MVHLHFIFVSIVFLCLYMVLLEQIFGISAASKEKRKKVLGRMTVDDLDFSEDDDP